MRCQWYNEVMVKKHTGKSIFLSVLLIVTLAFSPTTSGQSKQTKRKTQSIYQPIEDQAIKRVEPSYDLYHLGRIETDVVGRVIVDEKGNVISARAISGHPLLLTKAVFAAKDWKFSPKIRNGKAVKNRGTITFHFRPDTRRPNAEDTEKNTQGHMKDRGHG
jgi:TonB family protein